MQFGYMVNMYVFLHKLWNRKYDPTIVEIFYSSADGIDFKKSHIFKDFSNFCFSMNYM